MKLPYLRETTPSQRQITAFGGYNHNLKIGDGELFDMRNLTSDSYPLLSPRGKRGEKNAIANPNGIFAKGKLAWVDGTAFYYGGELKGTVTDGKKQFASMGAYLLIFPDKKYYNTAADEFGSLENTYVSYEGDVKFTANSIVTNGLITGFKQYDGITITGSTVPANNKTAVVLEVRSHELIFADNSFTESTEAGIITMKRAVPDMEFFTENENRLWGCKGNEIFASKLGDPFNWNCYEGISTDSYAATVGTDGEFTGAVTHLGYVLFFKEDMVHKVYGTLPSNFQITNSSVRGVAKGCEKSIAIVNETLYYMTRNGVVAYRGGLPESVSEAFGAVRYTEAAAGALGNKYYLSAKDTAGTWHMLVYDDEKGMWHKEDNTHAVEFAFLGGELYYLDADGYQLKTVTGTEEGTVSWMAEFGDWDFGSLNRKYLSKLQIQVELAAGASMDVKMKYDSGASWETVRTVRAKKKLAVTIPVLPRRCGHVRLQLSGRGDCKVYAIGMTIEEGSER